MSDTLVTVDDSDLARIQYSQNPGWFTGGSSSEFNHTTHGTTHVGATATFVFNGTSITVYGTINIQLEGKPAPITEFLIDGSSSARFAPTPGSNTLYDQTLFASAGLQPAEHTLVMRTTVDDSYVWLDFLQYTPFAETKTPGSTTSLSSVVNATPTDSLQTTDGAATGTVRTSDGATTNAARTTDVSSITTASVAPDSSKFSDVPAIIGGALGGAAAVLMIGCLIVFLCYRKRSLKRHSTTQTVERPRPGAPIPYMLVTSAADVIRRKGSSIQTETISSGSRSVVTEVASPPSYQSVAGVD